MSNLNTEEMQRIVDGAPDDYTHVSSNSGMSDDYYRKTGKGVWIVGYRQQSGDFRTVPKEMPSSARALNDLRTILSQQQEIEELKEELSTAIEIIEDSGIDYDEVVEAKGETDE